MALKPRDPALVSIVLPTFNGERYLRDAVQSCLDQTWKTLEIIVVVDGSTDGSRAVVAQFTDPRLRIVDRRENRGLPESLNEGFALARGRYFTWTSDDNVYHPTAIERMVQRLESDDSIDLVYAGYDIIDEEGKAIERVQAREPSSIWEENPVGACFLYSRRLAEHIGDYRPSVRLIEDYDYWLRASKHFRFDAIADTLYGYRYHALSLTGRLSVFDRARASARLKRSLRGIPDSSLRKELARVDIAEAFTRFQECLYRDVLRLAARAIARDPRLLLNRGVVSIVSSSVLRSFDSRTDSIQHD